MKMTMALIAATLAATPGQAADWRWVGSTGDAPDRTVFLIDAGSIVRSGDRVVFNSASIYERITETRDFDFSIIGRDGNCATHASAMTRQSYYSEGEELSTDLDRGPTQTHAPGAIMYGVLEVACGRRTMPTQSFNDPDTQVRARF